MEETVKPIYIEQLFKSKNPKLARWIPKFVYSFLKRLICQDQINDFISKYGDRKGLDFADGVMEYLDLSFKIEGEENLPDPNGRYIFAANHVLGGPDGIILISYLGRKYSPLKFPVNDLLMNLKNLNNIFLPVNKHGALAKEAAADLENAFASNAQIITFPAGMVSRKTKGVIIDPEWQKSFIVKAVKYQRDIVPIHVKGENSKFFYNLANFRKKIGLKVNLEMMCLPKETFNKKGSTFTLSIGKPIPWETFDKSKTPKEWAAEVKKNVYSL
ncbi:glycerol acyltransferase [Butyricimonas hominis]|uniref:Glycerol acyltransferase n=1 Tax=Butyricimonas hominis TaxID=2763032 RepID=A0ABR7CXW6_9BACT|nr:MULTISPECIES: glycerol acyltransferase [Butyricimonas]MBC5620526.1 glycerol acyltransferase [Butyricimonas hominis]